MKVLLLLFAIVACGSAHAQQVTISRDTIYNSNRPLALIAERKELPVRYHISSFGGDPLVRISDARMELNGKPAYVVTFINNKKKAMLTSENRPLDIVKELVNYHVMTRMGAIDTLAENIFIKNHPLPKGYADVDRPMEPGHRIRIPKK